MSNNRTVNKKIKNEYQRLEEVILKHMSVNKHQDDSKSNELLEEVKEAQKGFIGELNHAEKITNDYVSDLLKRVVDDVDKRYKALKGLVTKK